MQVFCSRLEAVTGYKISRIGPCFPVEFAAERYIKLEIPDSLTGWVLTYLSHPDVSYIKYHKTLFTCEILIIANCKFFQLLELQLASD